MLKHLAAAVRGEVLSTHGHTEHAPAAPEGFLATQPGKQRRENCQCHRLQEAVPQVTSQRTGIQSLDAQRHMLKETPTIKCSLLTTFIYDRIFKTRAVLKNLMLIVAVLLLENCNDLSTFFFRG